MRLLLIMRGPPGCGKSTWIEAHGLLPYTLSHQQLTLQFANPTFQKDGSLGLNTNLRHVISNFMEKQLTDRLKRGETTVIDSNASNREMLAWANIARKYQYKILVINFSTSLETCLQHNEGRRGTLSYVSSQTLTHLWNSAQNSKDQLKKHLRLVSAENFSIEDEFSLKIHNLEQYQEVISVGDIHGCKQHLQKLLPKGIEKNKFYLFVGDYLDRGYDNAGVMDWFWENCFEADQQKPNIVLLAGNHERYLQAWLNDEHVTNDEFTGRTRPELLAGGWHPAVPKFKIFLKSLRSYFCYEFHGKKVFLSHAGVPAPLKSIWKVSARDFEKGWGNHETDIDKIFAENANAAGFYQIHGHRNAYNVPIIANEYSINLAGRVEFGGELRAVRHTKEGFIPVSVNVTIETAQKKYQIIDLPKEITDLFTEPSCPHCDADLFADLKTKKNIQITPQKGWQNIVSLRLKKNNEKERTSLLKPQGLFLNQKTNTILARSYDKFVKIGGKQSLEKITKTFAYPVSARIKENGFLGLTGCDGKNRLLLGSRNYLTGPFAESFSEKIDETLGNKILTLNETFGVSCVFEVIDPDNFPNIVKYRHPKLILLDVIYRETNFKKLPYEALSKIAAFLNIPFSQQKAIFHNENDFLNFLKNAEQEECAGYIFEDQNHFIVKYRTPYYQAWTLMNSVIQTMLEGKKKHFPSDLLRLYRKYPTYFTESRQHILRGFYDYLDKISLDELGLGLIELRDRFLDGD